MSARTKAEQAIIEQIAVLESRSDLIQGVRELVTTNDIRATFDALNSETAETLLMVAVSTLMNCQAVGAFDHRHRCNWVTSVHLLLQQ